MVGDFHKITDQCFPDCCVHVDLVDALQHAVEPDVAHVAIDVPLEMPAAEHGMASLLEVGMWSAEHMGQEPKQPFLCRCEVFGIELPQFRLLPDMLVKMPDQIPHLFFSQSFIDIDFHRKSSVAAKESRIPKNQKAKVIKLVEEEQFDLSGFGNLTGL